MTIYPSRPQSAAQVVEDVKRVLKHLSDAEAIIVKKAQIVQKQIDWVRKAAQDNITEESETIASDLELRLDIYNDKIDQTQSISASLADYFNLH
jgi:hypothetical protein